MIRALALILLATPAAAHDWYDPACCSGQDCAAVVPGVVTVTPDGWRVHLNPGDHPLVRKSFSALIPFDDPKIRRSEDQDFHVCIGAVSNVIYCVYTPDMGA